MLDEIAGGETRRPIAGGSLQDPFFSLSPSPEDAPSSFLAATSCSSSHLATAMTSVGRQLRIGLLVRVLPS